MVSLTRVPIPMLFCLLAACGGSDGGGGGGAAGMTASEEEVCTSCDGACLEEVPADGAMHVTGPIDYADPPPTGGSHDPCWADYGVYDDPLPAERWVHNLEHGAVVFLYNCPSGCDDEVAAIGDLVTDLPRTLSTPYADMPEGFAVVAWGRRLVSSCLDVDAFRAFYDATFDRGLESVAEGAPPGCP